jgi:dienelactone hydrolase
MFLVFLFLGLGIYILMAMPALAQEPTRTSTLTRTSTPTVTATPKISATVALTGTATVTATRRITPTVTLTLTVVLTATPTVTTTADLTATVTPTATIVRATPTPTVTRYPLTLDPKYLSIDALRARKYETSQIQIVRTIEEQKSFRRVQIEYQSDGLKITGMMNIPRGAGPFPVVVLDHGYFKPAEYKTGDGTIRAADAFAQRGYLTISPDYRCYAGSQCGPNPFYIGYAIDVLNLIAALPSLSYADTSRIGIWGHSMGGGITIRVLAVSESLKVASLYGSLTGDDEVHYCWLYGCKTPLVTPVPPNSNKMGEFDPEFFQGVATPDTSSDYRTRLHEIFIKSSPILNLKYIDTPVIIHHGEADDIVPLQWSVDLATKLSAQGKTAMLYTYPGEGHVFAGWGWQLFMARTLAFFDEFLNPREAPITVDKRVLLQERVAADSSY